MADYREHSKAAPTQRPLRVGDRVTLTGTVTDVGINYPTVMFDGDTVGMGLAATALTLIEPAEPPIGSVVVKDDVAWTRNWGDYWAANGSPGCPVADRWSDLSDGNVIFTPGGAK